MPRRRQKQAQEEQNKSMQGTTVRLEYESHSNDHRWPFEKETSSKTPQNIAEGVQIPRGVRSCTSRQWLASMTLPRPTKRNQMHRMEQLLDALPVDPLPERRCQNPTGFGGETAAEAPSHPVDHWLENYIWPKGYHEPAISPLLTRERSLAHYKRRATGPFVERSPTTSRGKPGEEKSARHRE